MTIDNETAMREVFEKWFADNAYHELEGDREYAYRAWQAATAHHTAELERYKAAMVEAREALEKITRGNVAGYPGLAEDFRETCIRELIASKDVATKALAHLNTLLNEGK